MNCTECKNYNRAKGNKHCLTCPQYQDIIKTSGKRSTISIDTIPDIILEAIPDNKTLNLAEALKQLPLELSMPLLAYHLLNANQRELSAYLKTSQADVSRKINQAIIIIKKMTIND